MAGRRGIRRAAATVTAAVAAAALATGCGGGPSKPSYDVAPAWTLPAAVESAPSAHAFCRVLTVDYQHLDDKAAVRTTHDVEANFAGFFAALPALVRVAPSSLVPSVRLYVDVTRDFYEALMQKTYQHKAGPKALKGELTSPATARAVSAVDAYAAAHCHPDPL